MSQVEASGSAASKVISNIKVNESGCWEWQGSQDKDGYGRMRFENKFLCTHRVMCSWKHGQPPDGSPYSLHSCDNRVCCNPDHLRWGSQAENMADQTAKGRRWKGYAAQGMKPGDWHRGKLSKEAAQAVLDDPRKGADIAADHGISMSLVYSIKRGERFPHLKPTVQGQIQQQTPTDMQSNS